CYRCAFITPNVRPRTTHDIRPFRADAFVRARPRDDGSLSLDFQHILLLQKTPIACATRSPNSRHDRAAKAVGSLSHWERGGVRGYDLSIDPTPSPQPFPLWGAGAHRV